MKRESGTIHSARYAGEGSRRWVLAFCRYSHSCYLMNLGSQPMIDSGDTAFILAASALVLLMTPGLALFYGGLSRGKNAASTIMYSFATIGIVGVVWVLWGYTLAFGPDVGHFVGNFEFFGPNVLRF